LWTARAGFVAKLLGIVVAVMGVCFAVTAVALQPAPTALLRGALVPTVPEGAGWLVVAVVGTTVVPYNLFLGSGLAVGHSVRDVRIGLGVSVVAGGLVSMAVLVVGGSLVGEFSFAALAARLGAELGGWARGLFALGLFCAGLTSAITAPLAAAITARGLFAARAEERWSESSTRYRGVWIFVLVTGAVFALTTARPVQLIVAAQALNGVLLPVVAIFLMIAVNDRRLMGADGLNGALANALTALVVFVALTIGLSNLIAASVGRSAGLESIPWIGALAATALTSPFVARAARRRRMEDRSP
jgi:Mn2+/Fe2+ NRAMP family transporter